MNISERPIMDRSHQEISRRGILAKAGILFTAGALSALPDMKTTPSEIQPFSTSQVGWNINLVGLRYQPKDMADRLLSLPGETVRIPIPMDEVWEEKDHFNFDSTDRIIDAALEKGKKIDLQMGIKTIGWPEVHAPVWFVDQFPYLKNNGILIDENPEAKKYILEYLSHASQRYLVNKEIRTIHVENEPFSKRLSVTRNRHLSPAFNKEEVALVRDNDPYKRPFIQNVPLDTPSAIPELLHADILGINIYNQHQETILEKIPPKVFEIGLWTYIAGIVHIARSMGKQIKITEFQIAPWNNEPFSLTKMVEGLREIKKIDPEFGVAFWDAEKVIRSGNKDHIALMHNMVA